jgi:hypothetical protein
MVTAKQGVKCTVTVMTGVAMAVPGHSYDNAAAITPWSCSRTLLPIAR